MKDQLLREVNNPEYWTWLCAFLNNQCSKYKFDEKMASFLTTNSLRHAHNELLRALLFNAHFSTIPPPNVVVPKPISIAISNAGVHKQSNPAQNINSSFLYLFRCTEHRKIISPQFLKDRINIIVQTKNISSKFQGAEDSSILMILRCLKELLLIILIKGHKLIPTSLASPMPTMTLDTILSVLQNQHEIIASISPDLLCKIAFLHEN